MRLILLLLVGLCGCNVSSVAVEAKTLLWEVRFSLHNGDSGRRATNDCTSDCGAFARSIDAVRRD